MKRLFVMSVAVAAMLLVAACQFVEVSRDGVAPALANPSQTGHALVERYIALVADSDVAGLEDFLSDAFIRQGAVGDVVTKDAYLADLPELSQEYTLDEVTALQDGNTLVVRWMFSVEEVISGQQLQSTPAPRLSTFVWNDGEWRLISHANFNPPAQ